MSSPKKMRREAELRRRKAAETQRREAVREREAQAAARRAERDASPSRTARRSMTGMLPASMAVAALALAGM